MLRKWNVTLVVATFLLSILGTFITRSGVIESVHSFAQSPVGSYFAAFLVVTIAVTGFLVATRLKDLEARVRFYRDTFGLAVATEGEVEPELAEALWGTGRGLPSSSIATNTKVPWVTRRSTFSWRRCTTVSSSMVIEVRPTLVTSP